MGPARLCMSKFIRNRMRKGGSPLLDLAGVRISTLILGTFGNLTVTNRTRGFGCRPSQRCPRTGSLVLVVMLLVLFPDPAWAHAFGQRYDLPLPLWMFVTGGAAAVFLSFLVIALILKTDHAPGDYPTFNLLRTPVGRLLAHPAMVEAVRVIFVFFFFLTVVAGYIGDPSPYNNISVVMVWVVAWVGLAFVCSLAGNFWALINPWNALFRWGEKWFKRRDAGQDLSLNLPYPDGLGTWPAIIFFFVFAWMEITWPGAGVPGNVAVALSLYSGLTWLGMFLYGREIWLEKGEAFTVLYSLFARFAITEVRVRDREAAQGLSVYDIDDETQGCINGYGAFYKTPADQREWNLRLPGVGLRVANMPSITLMFFVLILLSTVSYDGYTETAHFQDTSLLIYNQILGHGQTASWIIDTVGFSSFPLLFVAAYLVAMTLVGAVSGSLTKFDVIAPLFVFSIVPISIAYHLSHYISLLVFEGQLLIGRLSDPFGFGWDLFGTADYKVDLTLMSAKFVWFFSIIAIVAGHVAAVYLSHAEAIRLYGRPARALKSQIPMMVLMVAYTMLSLWIIAQPIVS